jgi:phosphoglycerate dehydrogenase-like enzyme
MRVIAAGKTLTPERAAAAGVEYADLPALFETADIVSVSLKSTPAT